MWYQFKDQEFWKLTTLTKKILHQLKSVLNFDKHKNKRKHLLQKDQKILHIHKNHHVSIKWREKSKKLYTTFYFQSVKPDSKSATDKLYLEWLNCFTICRLAIMYLYNLPYSLHLHIPLLNIGMSICRLGLRLLPCTLGCHVVSLIIHTERFICII